MKLGRKSMARVSNLSNWVSALSKKISGKPRTQTGNQIFTVLGSVPRETGSCCTLSQACFHFQYSDVNLDRCFQTLQLSECWVLAVTGLAMGGVHRKCKSIKSSFQGKARWWKRCKLKSKYLLLLKDQYMQILFYILKDFDQQNNIGRCEGKPNAAGTAISISYSQDSLCVFPGCKWQI